MIADRCPHLLDLTISFTKEDEELNLPAIKAIASLPHLKILTIGTTIGYDFNMAEGAGKELARCYQLKHLSLCAIKQADLMIILRGIGRNLVGLSLIEIVWDDVVDIIVESCPNLQCLSVGLPSADAGLIDSFKLTLKSGLKRLAKLRVNGVTVRLGIN
jgi:hypothetical protein